ncbi:MAG: ABC transporter permease [Chloroflexi bacterium]|nr:ABC transporter permease [Chloroflexota bacterium]
MAIQELGSRVTAGGVSTRLKGASQAARRGLSIVLRTNTGRIGIAIVSVHLVLALFGPLLAPHSPTEFTSEDLEIRLTGPSLDHLLGTDKFGRDVLSRVMTGARSIIWISVIGTALGIALGTTLGMTAGYIGGKTDQLIMRGVDVLLSLPSLLLALLVINIGVQRITIDLWPSTESWLVILTIGIAFMPVVSRVIRSATLAVKPLEFVQSARLRGEPVYYIIFREILPNIIPVVAVEASIRISFALLLTASLGFLGLGVQPPSPDWGLMVSEARENLATAPWAALAPALAMGSLVVGVNLLADGIRQSVRLPLSREAP